MKASTGSPKGSQSPLQELERRAHSALNFLVIIYFITWEYKCLHLPLCKQISQLLWNPCLGDPVIGQGGFQDKIINPCFKNNTWKIWGLNSLSLWIDIYQYTLTAYLFIYTFFLMYIASMSNWFGLSTEILKKYCHINTRNKNKAKKQLLLLFLVLNVRHFTNP